MQLLCKQLYIIVSYLLQVSLVLVQYADAYLTVKVLLLLIV